MPVVRIRPVVFAPRSCPHVIVHTVVVAVLVIDGITDFARTAAVLKCSYLSTAGQVNALICL